MKISEGVSAKDRILNTANVLGAVWFIAVALLFFFMPGSYPILWRVMGLSLTCAGTAAFYFLSKSNKLIVKIKSIKPVYIYLAAAAFMLLIQLIILFGSGYRLARDAEYLDIIARNFVEKRDLNDGLSLYHSYYLDRYSNNWGIFLIEAFIYKCVYIVTGRLPSVTLPLVNIAVIQISFYLFCKLSRLVFTSERNKMLAPLVMAVHPVIYAYCCVFYTDTLSMPFVICAAYLTLKAVKSSGVRFAAHISGAALCIGVGYSIKGSVAVVLVASVIYMLFKGGIKKALALFAVSLIAFAAVNASVKSVMYASGTVSEESVERYGFPMTHWIMMGLKDRGGYDEEMFRYTYGIESKEARNEAAKEKIRETIADYGVTGMAKHAAIKLFYTWRGGQYLSTIQFSNADDTAVTKLFSGGLAVVIPNYVLQCALILYVMLSFISSAINRRTDGTFLLRLSVFGLSVFLMIWETRSRYLINMLPFMYIIMIEGVSELIKLIDCFVAKRKNKKQSAAE